MTLDSLFGGIVRDQDSIKRQFIESEAVANYFQFFNEEIYLTHTLTEVATRGAGSSFVLGDFQYGRLGAVATNQPYLGNNGGGTFETSLTQTPGSPFLDNGRTQVRDWILGSSAAKPPQFILLGSGTALWAATQSGLQYQTGSFTLSYAGGSAVGGGAQTGSYIVTIPSANLPVLGSVQTSAASVSLTSGLGISGNGVFTVYNSAPFNIPAGSNFTQECWVRLISGDTAGDRIIWIKRNGGTGWYQAMLPNGGSSLQFRYNDGGGEQLRTASGVQVLNDGSWRHVAICQSDGSLYGYIDGKKVIAAARIPDALSNADLFRIGNPSGRNQPLPGSVDDFRWTLSGLYPSGTGFTPGSTQLTALADTKGLWHFNAFAASPVVTDFSGGGNDGSVLGTAVIGQGYTYSGANAVFATTYATQFSEIALSGGKVFLRDTFSTVSVGSTGSEIRFVVGFRVGSYR